MSKSYEYYSQTFSQREGRSPLPEPMRLEHLSSTFRNEVWFCIDQTILKFGTDGNRKLLGVYRGSPISVFIFFYIRKVVDTPHDEIMNEMHEHRHLLKQVITKGSYDSVLTFIEMFLRYPNLSYDRILSELWEELKGLFERVPVAYAVKDMEGLPTIVPCSSPESGAATTRAIETVEQKGSEGAKKHLRRAAEHLNAQHYAESVRESIHAVESVARTIDPKASKELKPALDSLTKAGVLRHRAFKDALNNLYGYTNDEKGIRHPFLNEGTANVDLGDAMFMFSACAIFCDYLLSRRQSLKTE